MKHKSKFIWAKPKFCGHGTPETEKCLANEGKCDWPAQWSPMEDRKDPWGYIEAIGTDEGYQRDSLIFGPEIPPYDP